MFLVATTRAESAAGGVSHLEVGLRGVVGLLHLDEALLSVHRALAEGAELGDESVGQLGACLATLGKDLEARGHRSLRRLGAGEFLLSLADSRSLRINLLLEVGDAGLGLAERGLELLLRGEPHRTLALEERLGGTLRGLRVLELLLERRLVRRVHGHERHDRDGQERNEDDEDLGQDVHGEISFRGTLSSPRWGG
jgi:hypothetical protein